MSRPNSQLPDPQQPEHSLTVDQLCNALQQLAQIEPTAQRVSQIRQLTAQFQSDFVQQPQLWQAQIYQYKSHYQPLTNYHCTKLCLIALICQRHGYSQTTSASLLAASLSSQLTTWPILQLQLAEQPLSAKQQQLLSHAAQLSYQRLKQCQLNNPLWLKAVSQYQHYQQQRQTSYPRAGLGLMLKLSDQIAMALNQKSQLSQQHPSQVLALLYQNTQDQLSRSWLNQLATDINPTALGSLVQLKSSQNALVIKTASSTAASSELTVYPLTAENLRQPGKPLIVSQQQIIAFGSRLSHNNPLLYQQLWLIEPSHSAQAPETAAVTTTASASQDLLAQLTELTAPATTVRSWLAGLSELSIAQLVVELNSQPWLSRQLLQYASQLSKQQRPIQSLKHAINMIGISRLALLSQYFLLRQYQQRHQSVWSQLQQPKLDYLQRAIAHYAQPHSLDPLPLLSLCQLWFNLASQQASLQLSSQLSSQTTELNLNQLFQWPNNNQLQQHMQQCLQQWSLPLDCQLAWQQLNTSPTATTTASTTGQTSTLAVLQQAIATSLLAYSPLSATPTINNQLQPLSCIHQIGQIYSKL